MGDAGDGAGLGCTQLRRDVKASEIIKFRMMLCRYQLYISWIRLTILFLWPSTKGSPHVPLMKSHVAIVLV